jgi:hypothetical protein
MKFSLQYIIDKGELFNELSNMKLGKAELVWPGGDTPGILSFKSKDADYGAEIIIKALRGGFPDTQIDIYQVSAVQPISDIPGRYRFSSKNWLLVHQNICPFGQFRTGNKVSSIICRPGD